MLRQLLISMMLVFGSVTGGYALVTHPVTLAWNANPSTTGYKVYRSLQSCVSNPTLTFLVDVGLVTTFIDTSIPVTASNVCYAITAYNAWGESGQSATAGKTVNLAPGAVTNGTFN